MSSFEDEGNCYELVNRYLKLSNRAFIVDDALKARSCNWNFKGNTLADFETWCRVSGLRCGGNPYYVGYDSTWHQGHFVPRNEAEFLRQQEAKADSAARYATHKSDSLSRAQWLRDSVSSVPLPLRFATIEYLEISKGTAENLGFRYSDWIGTAKFFEYTDLFAVSIQAQELGDTSFVYRQYETYYDSTLSVFWGGKRDRVKSSSITANGIISENYETETYGLTFRISDMAYTYNHSTDYEHEINGSGKLVPGTNDIFGSYQAYLREESGLPFLKDIPLIGALFRHSTQRAEWRYIFLRVRVGASRETLLEGVTHYVPTESDTTRTRDSSRVSAERTLQERGAYPPPQGGEIP